MNKGRFLEDVSEWVYNLLFHNGYSAYSDDYWVGFVFMFLALLLVVAIGWGLYSWIYSIIDNRTAILTEYTGKLIDKKYIGESDSSGTGTALVSTGSGVGVGLVSTSSHSDEEFLFFIKADKVYKCEVDMQNYYHFKINDGIKFSVLIGGKSGSQLEIKLV